MNKTIANNQYRGSSPNAVSSNAEFAPTRFWIHDEEFRVTLFLAVRQYKSSESLGVFFQRRLVLTYIYYYSESLSYTDLSYTVLSSTEFQKNPKSIVQHEILEQHEL